jgi:hypothetical protein
MTELEFDPGLALDTLSRNEVRFVVIGGIAANLWGSPSATYDLDICYARDPDNLTRLARALIELKARLRGAPEGLPFRLDARTLRAGDHCTFIYHRGGSRLSGDAVRISGVRRAGRESHRARSRGRSSARRVARRPPADEASR